MLAFEDYYILTQRLNSTFLECQPFRDTRFNLL